MASLSSSKALSRYDEHRLTSRPPQGVLYRPQTFEEPLRIPFSMNSITILSRISKPQNSAARAVRGHIRNPLEDFPVRISSQFCVHVAESE